MKKLIIFLALFILLILLLSVECKKNNNGPKYNESDLYGTWSASIGYCDTNIGHNNKVTIVFDPGNAAYLNYNGSKGNLWSSSYKCKWWINYTNVPFSHDDTKYQSYLYILRFDTLGYPCHFPCINCSFIFPDTSLYVVTNVNSNTLNLELLSRGYTPEDIFFSDHTALYTPYTKTLYK